MAQSLRTAHTDEAPAKHGKYKLDELDAVRMARHLALFVPTDEIVQDLMAKARAAIPGIAATETILKVLRYNPDCFTAVVRKSRFNPDAPSAEGFIAILPVNDLGVMQLALGTFNGPDPDLRLVAKPGERPAGIYMWCVFTPGPLAPAIALFMNKKLSSSVYAGVDLYSRPNTDVGRHFNQVLGLTQGIQIGPIDNPNVWRFPRKPPQPSYDSYVPKSGNKAIGVTVVRTFDDLARAAAIRNAVYIGEQECPYDEEYDGNDLTATHLLVYIGDEPVGCLRLRFFAGFAKLERLAIHKHHRKSRAAFQLVNAAFDFCRKKGFQRIYAHSQVRVVDFWSRFGFAVMKDAARFNFSDYEYVEIVAELDADPNAVHLESGPYVLIRPEGRWHEPGVLEMSAARKAAQK